MENQRIMEGLKESQRSMKGLQISMMEEFRLSRIQNLKIRERLEKTNKGPEGRMEKD